MPAQLLHICTKTKFLRHRNQHCKKWQSSHAYYTPLDIYKIKAQLMCSKLFTAVLGLKPLVKTTCIFKTYHKILGIGNIGLNVSTTES